MNKYTIGTILGTGLLSLIKSHTTGSSARKLEYYNEYHFGTFVFVHLKHKKAQENMVVTINNDEDDEEFYDMLFQKPEVVQDYQSPLNSDKIRVRYWGTYINRKSSGKKLFKISVKDNIRKKNRQMAYNSSTLEIDLKITMMVNCFSTITIKDVVDMVDKQIKSYIQNFLDANPDFEVLHIDYRYPFYSEIFKHSDNIYDGNPVFNDPNIKLNNTFQHVFQDGPQGTTQISDDKPRVIIQPSFLQNAPICKEWIDELRNLKKTGEYDPDEDYFYARIEKFGDLRDFYKPKAKPSKLRRR